ncbi:extracellular solute-binding protein [Paenibacillus sp. Marseille-Q4541]|uniref:ABC transporter substrate-binding protein n=1 Tax=Paenibacillus sp. Marseille-Q4541 TaxID=2831522 RepID=UPI0020184118|nr:extracellular solute-binding protein [Paenibacillus sp. Marseille-Q4541]
MGFRLLKGCKMLLLAGGAMLMLTACNSSGTSDKVQLEFFQNKAEAKESFDKLVKKFNSEQSEIEVTQVNPPDAETVLKTRLVKNDVPDIMALGATDTFSVLSQSHIFMEQTDQEMINLINPSYLEMVTDTSGMDELTGIPYATNANGIMYNKTLFKEMGLEVPKTWDELLKTAGKIKDAGKIPFYLTYKDDWQTNLAFNALAPNLEGIDFYLERRANETTFQERYREVAEKQLAILDYGHSDNFGKTYADGNRAFANGDAYMYIQGTWAIPEIRKANPDIEIGFFPFPTSNNPEEINLVNGIDTLLTVSEDTEYKEESVEFIKFLLREDNIKQYITEQNLFAAVEGVIQEDPSVAGVIPYIEEGRVTDFADHYIPAAVQLNSIVQEFLQNRDIDAYLAKLDKEWDKVANRR